MHKPAQSYETEQKLNGEGGGNRIGRRDEPDLAESGVSSGQHSQHWTSPQRRSENYVRDESKILRPVKTG